MTVGDDALLRIGNTSRKVGAIDRAFVLPDVGVVSDSDHDSAKTFIPFRLLVEESTKRDSALKVTHSLATVIEDATHVLLDHFVNVFCIIVVDAELVFVTFFLVIDFELLDEKIEITVTFPGVGENDRAASLENVLLKMLKDGAALAIGDRDPVSAANLLSVRIDFSDGEEPDAEASRTSSFVVLAVAKVGLVD